MANQHFSTDFTVEVGGTALPPRLATLLVEAYVEDNRTAPDAFELRFSRNVLAEAGFAIGAEVTLSVKPSDRSQPVVLVVGEVVGVEAEWSADGQTTVVRGLDHAHRLFHRHVAAYPDLSVAEIVRQVAQRAGLKVGRVDDVAGFAGDQDTQVSQDGETDWALLQRLAALVGAECVVVEGVLEFRLPAPPDGAPDEATTAQADPLVLELGQNLLTAQAGVSAVGQPASVAVRGWDPMAKQAVVASTAVATTSATVTAYPPQKLAAAFDGPELSTADWPVRTAAAAEVVAAAYADRIAASAVSCFGVARGNPALRSGAAVRLANLGAPFDMTCVLSRTRHRFTPDAPYWYVTEFEVAGGTDRSLAGLIATTDRPTARGLLTGQVSDVNDPAKLGRVRVTFPWLSDDYLSGWARIAQPAVGIFWLPEVGDEVLVGFDRGDFDSPFVLGGLYNGVDPPPQFDAAPVDGGSGGIVRRCLRTTAGHRLLLAESPGGTDEVRLETAGGGLTLLLDKQNTKIGVASDGTVTITAKQGVSIDAGSGALTLAGRSVEITGQSSVKLASAAGASVELTAAAVVAGNPIKLN